MSAVATSRRRERAVAGTNDPVGLVEAAFVRADYTGAKLILRAVEARTAAQRGSFALIEARCARAEDDVEALLAAAERAANDHPDAAGKLEAVALRGVAHRLGNRTALADRDFDRVRQRLEREPDVASGLATHYLAHDAWTRGALDDAEALLAINLGYGKTKASDTALLGWCALKRERFSKAGAYFIESLRLIRASETPDLRAAATTLYGASIVASESVDLKLAKKLQREFAAMEWPASLAVYRFNTITAFRLIALLEGDLERAWVLSRDAVSCAPNAAYAVTGETNAAVASRLLGDERTAMLQLRRAWEIVRQQRLGAPDNEARLALANFAREAASDLPAEARKAMTMCDSLTPRENRTNALTRDRRVLAFELMAQGRVAEVRGNYDAAYDRYRSSFDLWRESHYDMRAALVALDLMRLARDPIYDETLEAVLERAPSAWFAPQASPANELLERITPAETLVLGALLGGKSARAIAEDLERSVHTINNHTRKIFQAFGVTSRSAVLAQCAEFGITPKSLDRIS